MDELLRSIQLATSGEFLDVYAKDDVLRLLSAAEDALTTALVRVTYLESQLRILVRELRHIEGISTGQVNRVATQALAQLRDNAGAEPPQVGLD